MGNSRTSQSHSTAQNSSRRVYNHQNEMNEQEVENNPTLILDVNLGDKTDRIALYREDEDNLAGVAEEFARKHNLDE